MRKITKIKPHLLCLPIRLYTSIHELSCVSVSTYCNDTREGVVGRLYETGAIPGLGRSPGGGHGSPLQYPCLENPMDRGGWQATYSPQGHKESDTTEETSHTRSVPAQTQPEPPRAS